MYLTALCSVFAQPIASDSNGFLYLDAKESADTGSSSTASLPQEPFFLDNQAASIPFLPNIDPFSISLRIISSLFVIIILALTLSWIIQRKGGLGGNVYGKVIGVIPIDSRRFIYIVDVVGRIMVLGITESNINLLCEITDKNTMDSLRLQGETPAIPGMEKFFAFLKKNRNDDTSPESEEEISNHSVKDQTKKNNARLNKINSLLVKRNPSNDSKTED